MLVECWCDFFSLEQSVIMEFMGLKHSGSLLLDLLMQKLFLFFGPVAGLK